MVDPKKPAESKTFPVKLLKNYRPVGAFMVEGDDELRAPNEQEIEKVKAGARIHLPIEEAKAIIAKRIADRNDAIA